MFRLMMALLISVPLLLGAEETQLQRGGKEGSLTSKEKTFKTDRGTKPITWTRAIKTTRTRSGEEKETWQFQFVLRKWHVRKDGVGLWVVLFDYLTVDPFCRWSDQDCPNSKRPRIGKKVKIDVGPGVEKEFVDFTTDYVLGWFEPNVEDPNSKVPAIWKFEDEDILRNSKKVLDKPLSKDALKVTRPGPLNPDRFKPDEPEDPEDQDPDKDPEDPKDD